MSASNMEAELKFELQPAEIDRLRNHAALRELTVGRATTRTLLSIYYDTADDALFNAGLSLRVRKDGRKWIQTVKQGKAVRAGLSTPMELEVSVPGAEPHLDMISAPEVAREIVRRIGEAPLLARFETRMRRTIRTLKVEEGDVEFALDSGEIVAGERTLPLLEAELELLTGSLGALYEVARLLFDDGPIRFSPLSKAARGYRLARGEKPDPFAPQTGLVHRMAAEMTAEEAYADILRACLDRIAHNRLATIAGDDPEGPHQLRVALRRLRSAFTVFAPLADTAETHRLDAEAKRIGQLVGGLRDADVIISDIVQPAASRAPDGAKALIATLEARRVKTRANVIAGLSEPSLNAFLLDLGRYAETRGWLTENIDQTALLAQPVADFAASALERRWKSCVKGAAKLQKLNIEQRHALRKKLKSLRYAVEFFAGLAKPRKLKPFVAELKALQDVFGYLNDVAMARKLIDIDPGSRTDRDKGLLAAGYVMGWHQANADHAWAAAKARWKALEKVEKWWA
ncbi:inorganic triphosphatase YgiF [Breoghania corrubedonensis]|uniref:Inorganic triphosphatase YgiF n=1 Tax=Breoghania corrubedonensis TaxID=665038 RepID=A0A2T5VFC6_9HYPH|nr:CYTH and CHAD domain-containing protein [Breoghania corrubedonensis]PTW62457.1 inorganic triphosphatase YgiF [Breoghania corrubedonensis]